MHNGYTKPLSHTLNPTLQLRLQTKNHRTISPSVAILTNSESLVECPSCPLNHGIFPLFMPWHPISNNGCVLLSLGMDPEWRMERVKRRRGRQRRRRRRRLVPEEPHLVRMLFLVSCRFEWYGVMVSIRGFCTRQTPIIHNSPRRIRPLLLPLLRHPSYWIIPKPRPHHHQHHHHHHSNGYPISETNSSKHHPPASAK